MNVERVALPLANRLAREYQQQNESALSFFAHNPYRDQAYRERLEWLSTQTFNRLQLAEGLHNFNQAIGNHPEALDKIELLKQQDTYVVIGGQQAGVLTGPLYTINKAVHLIQAAKKLSAELQVNVVPVFWIAGEDHDIDEIDHVYWTTDGDTRLHKERLSLKKRGRASASKLPLEEEVCMQFLETFFQEQTETAETKNVRELLTQTAKSSSTVVEWFARLLAQLFGKHGLILVESSLPFVRELERPVFQQVIEKNEQMAQLLVQASERLATAGYPLQLEVDEHQANLFIYEGEDRLLLSRHLDRFVNRRQSYSRDELLALVQEQPERFSANVVTRGLMQEQLFPTLAFIGGPGEIAYWAYYREVFALFGMQMPIVLPRMSITLVEGAHLRLLEGLELSVEQVLTGFTEWKADWEKKQGPHPLHEQFAQVRQSIEQLYRPLVDEVIRLDPGMRGLSEKNSTLLLEQVSFLEERLIRSLQQKEDVAYNRIKRIETTLLPEGGLQERKLCFFPFANKYGLELIDRMVEAPFTHDGTHQLFFV
ncbi:bacillithiol biosynthesis cysteine-adding enzyme BshC [Brevibacillus parabrevis]|uniref:Putative cysteine ligase BshC n=1 Tax=Brevibacillus parabrevis TaxID=54914 RepID=A0A4Y3PP09_BREPA|nr:bacillithiol biosynthesis cysteine-adding enzyme BshC [Brevibacillus parabrevis]MBU8711681.1 bacillithiol biosynthesis cysteine-adding enzyme BshC [Brevibacillus parabrevis]RNB94037.1 bacillithiol biosynthesis cysteine-adding enzyme BshC [Brevibacillus parabrevis]GEB33088.1 putative cysteine ligase BshC [Brevibacillus parabrevis]